MRLTGHRHGEVYLSPGWDYAQCRRGMQEEVHALARAPMMPDVDPGKHDSPLDGLAHGIARPQASGLLPTGHPPPQTARQS